MVMTTSTTMLALNELEPTVIDSRKSGSHTDYAIRITPSSGPNGRSESAVVYRRFSAFVQLHRLVTRHFHDVNYCCGGDSKCLLSNFVRPVFDATEFSTTKLQGLIARNSKSVVNDRINFLNAFLSTLQDALTKCPPIVLHRCEQENCKLTKLLKSFFGCLESPRLARARSV